MVRAIMSWRLFGDSQWLRVLPPWQLGGSFWLWTDGSLGPMTTAPAWLMPALSQSEGQSGAQKVCVWGLLWGPGLLGFGTWVSGLCGGSTITRLGATPSHRVRDGVQTPGEEVSVALAPQPTRGGRRAPCFLLELGAWTRAGTVSRKRPPPWQIADPSPLSVVTCCSWSDWVLFRR